MNKRFLGIVLVGVIAIVVAAFVLPKRAEVSDVQAINIGAPSDTGGIIAVELARTKRVAGRPVEAYPLKDCCGTKTEYALSVDLLDAAIMCPDAADRLVERDERYAIVGTLVVNSDVIVAREGAVRTVALSQRRAYQEDVAREAFGTGVVLRPMLTSAIPYAIERGEVDAAVMDVLDARALDQAKSSIAGDGVDIATYTLVVTRELMSDSGYEEFLAALGAMADDLNDPNRLNEAIEARTGSRLSAEEAEAWEVAGTRFVAPRK